MPNVRKYRRKYRRDLRKKHSSIDYLMPFLILICVGVIVVLLFNLWSRLNSTSISGGADLHIVEGNLSLKVWGTDQFVAINSDTVVMQGDEIQTSSDSKLIIEFKDGVTKGGTIVRFAPNTTVAFDIIDYDTKLSHIELNLLNGSIWVNKSYKNTLNTKFIVNTKNLLIDSYKSSVFSVGYDGINNEFIRVKSVFDDNFGAKVSILSNSSNSVVESEEVRLAQEIVFTKAILNEYWDFKSPTVLSGISSSFVSSDWYVWNSNEDKKPSVFDTVTVGVDDVGLLRADPEVDGEVLEDFEDVDPVDSNEDTTGDSDGADDQDINGEDEKSDSENTSMQSPELVSVSNLSKSDVNENGFYLVDSSPAVLKGSVLNATKLVVNDYTLTKFVEGDSQWVYYAGGDLLKKGENEYKVYSLDSNGGKSDVLTIKVFYEPKAEPVAVVNDESSTSNGENLSDESDASSSDDESSVSDESDIDNVNDSSDVDVNNESVDANINNTENVADVSDSALDTNSDAANDSVENDENSSNLDLSQSDDVSGAENSNESDTENNNAGNNTPVNDDATPLGEETSG